MNQDSAGWRQVCGWIDYHLNIPHVVPIVWVRSWSVRLADFMAQTGDPSNSGEGGRSVFKAKDLRSKASIMMERVGLGGDDGKQSAAEDEEESQEVSWFCCFQVCAECCDGLPHHLLSPCVPMHPDGFKQHWNHSFDVSDLIQC